MPYNCDPQDFIAELHTTYSGFEVGELLLAIISFDPRERKRDSEIDSHGYGQCGVQVLCQSECLIMIDLSCCTLLVCFSHISFVCSRSVPIQ